VDSTYSDPTSGEFAFDDLRGAAYHIVVQAELYRPVDVEVVIRPIYQQVVHVNIELEHRIKHVASQGSAPLGSESGTVRLKELEAGFSKTVLKAFEKGKRARDRGDLDEAVRHYRQALRAAPEFVPALTNLGSIYLRRQKLAEAEKVFGEAHRLDAASAEACINLGHVYLLTGRLTEAAELLRRGTRLAPYSALGHFLLGSALARQGSLAASETSLKRAVDLDDPAVVVAHLELASLYMKTQRWSEARQALETYLRASPQDPQADAIRQTLRRIQSQQGHEQ
jgi:tetratricopeptide (TPR) repeat protein